MNCPLGHGELTPRSHKGIEVHACGECQGIFLDHGELNTLAEPTTGDLEFSTLHGDSRRHADEHGALKCPRCADSEMDKVEFTIYTDIILDYCARCEGFWLDGREIDRIDDEVRQLNEASQVKDPPMLWFAQFIWRLPR